MSSFTKAKSRIALVVREIGCVTADQIVDDPDLDSRSASNRSTMMAADESGAAGDDRGLARGGHFASIFFIVRTL